MYNINALPAPTALICSFHATSILVTTVGLSSSPYAAGLAWPVRVDEVDTVTNATYRTLSLPSSSGGGAPACTLGTASTTNWNQMADGLSSNSQDGQFAIVPCFNIPAGDDMTMISSKSIFLIDKHGSITSSSPIYPYVGDGDLSGWRQVASVDGTSFYLTGASSDLWGVRYVPSLTSRTTFFVAGSAGPASPGYTDARGIGFHSTQGLVATAGPTDAGDSIFVASSSAALPTTDNNNAYVLNSITTLNAWSFVVQQASRIWFSADFGAGAHGSIVLWDSSLATPVTVDPNYPIFSIVGRTEAWSSGHFVIYGASQAGVYRVDTNTSTVTLVRAPVSGEFIRGVALPPL